MNVVPSNNSSTFGRLLLAEARRVWRQPKFVAALAVLLMAAFTLNAATGYLRLYFKKQPVEPSRQLDSVPLHIVDGKNNPLWECISRDEALPDDLAQTLGTERFIFRDYVDMNARGVKSEVETFRAKGGRDARDSKALLDQIRREHPEAVVNLAVTYYTGKADTVAHIPERCYIADGYEPTESEDKTWVVNSPRSNWEDKEGKIPVRFISFEDQAGASQVTRNVAYFFHCNGHYDSNPAAVRMRLQNLFEKYGYYLKVEVMVQWKERDKAAPIMVRFLSDVLPEIEKSFPQRPDGNW